MAQVSTVLRWGGRLVTLAGGVNAFVPVGDCGSVIQPDALSGGTVLCGTLIADRWETVWLLVGVGVAAMIAGQVIGWRGRSGPSSADRG